MSRIEQLHPVIDHYDQGSGSMLFCLRDMKAVAARWGWTDLEVRIDHATDACRIVRRVNYDWRQHKMSGPTTRTDSVGLDVEIDHALSHLAATARGFAESSFDSAARTAGRKLTAEVFPRGVFPITSLKYEEEHHAVAELVDRLHNDYPGEVAALALTEVVDGLAQLNDRFGRALGEIDVPITFDQVEEARVSAREAFAKVFILALSKTLDDPDKRHELLAAYYDQQARIAHYYDRRGNTPAMDPATGEPIEEPGAPATDDAPTPVAE